jgi:hypothetical protein
MQCHRIEPCTDDDDDDDENVLVCSTTQGREGSDNARDAVVSGRLEGLHVKTRDMKRTETPLSHEACGRRRPRRDVSGHACVGCGRN